jgi:hypothetical protein
MSSRTGHRPIGTGYAIAVFVRRHLGQELELGGDAQRGAGDGFFLLPHDRRAIGALFEPIIAGGVVGDLVDLFQDVLEQPLLGRGIGAAEFLALGDPSPDPDGGAARHALHVADLADGVAAGDQVADLLRRLSCQRDAGMPDRD